MEFIRITESRKAKSGTTHRKQFYGTWEEALGPRLKFSQEVFGRQFEIPVFHEALAKVLSAEFAKPELLGGSIATHLLQDFRFR